MKGLRSLAKAFGLAVAAVIATAAPVFAVEPENLFKAVGVDVFKLTDESLIEALGAFASLYISVLNGFVVVAMLLFTAASGRIVFDAVVASRNDKVGEETLGTATMTAIKSVVQAGLLTVFALIMITSSISFITSFALGTMSTFDVAPSEVSYFGFFGPFVEFLQEKGSLALVLLGTLIIGWGAVRAIWPGGADASGGGGKEGAFGRLQAVIKATLLRLILVVIGFVIIRMGPQMVAQAFGIADTLGGDPVDLNMDVPTGVLYIKGLFI